MGALDFITKADKSVYPGDLLFAGYLLPEGASDSGQLVSELN